jgi:hypothetical protein
MAHGSSQIDRGPQPGGPVPETERPEHRRQQTEAQERQHDDEERAEPREQDPTLYPQQRRPHGRDGLRVHAEQIHPQERQHVERHEQQQCRQRARERGTDAAPAGLLEVASATDADGGIGPQQARDLFQGSAVWTCDRHAV